MTSIAATSAASVSPTPANVRRYAPIVATLLALAIIYLGSPNFHDSGEVRPEPLAGDFLQEWIGGRIVLEGDLSRMYDPRYAQSLEHEPDRVGFVWEKNRYLPIVYPPFYYLLLSPLAMLSYRAAMLVWAILMVGCFAATCWLVQRHERFAGSPNLTTRGGRLWANALPWLMPAALFFAPLTESLVSGQKGTLCLLIVATTYYMLKQERSFTAGLVFGLIAFKPQLALPIAVAMLCKRQWRFVAGGAITGATLALLCLPLGIDVCRQYVEFSTGTAEYIRTAGYGLAKSHCLYGFFALLLGNDSAWVKPLTLVSDAAAIALLGWLLRGKLHTASQRFDLQFSAMILLTLLLSPHLMTYDLALLLVPVYLAVRHRASSPSETIPLWPALLMLGVSGLSPQLAALTGVQLTVICMAVWLGIFAKSPRSCRAVSSIETAVKLGW